VSITLYTGAEYRRRLADKNPFLTSVLAGDHITLIQLRGHAGGG
jgi:hypothetical protein